MQCAITGGERDSQGWGRGGGGEEKQRPQRRENWRFKKRLWESITLQSPETKWYKHHSATATLGLEKMSKRIQKHSCYVLSAVKTWSERIRASSPPPPFLKMTPCGNTDRWPKIHPEHIFSPVFSPKVTTRHWTDRALLLAICLSCTAPEHVFPVWDLSCWGHLWWLTLDTPITKTAYHCIALFCSLESWIAKKNNLAAQSFHLGDPQKYFLCHALVITISG